MPPPLVAARCRAGEFGALEEPRFLFSRLARFLCLSQAAPTTGTDSTHTCEVCVTFRAGGKGARWTVWSTRHAAGRLLWLAATAVGHQGLFNVRHHHRAARKPRLTRAKATNARRRRKWKCRRRPPRRAAPRAAPRLALQQRTRAHASRARARSARAKRPSSRESNLEPKAPGSNRGPAQPPLLRFNLRLIS